MFGLRIPFVVSTKTAGLFINISVFCRHKHGWRCPQVSSRARTCFVVTNTARNCPKDLLKTPSFFIIDTAGDVLTSHQKLLFLTQLEIDLISR